MTERTERSEGHEGMPKIGTDKNANQYLALSAAGREAERTMTGRM